MLNLLVSWIDWVPEMSNVGIGYNRRLAEWASLREIDLHKRQEDYDPPPDSNAYCFLAALKQELIPFIDANYRTDPHERTLCG